MKKALKVMALVATLCVGLLGGCSAAPKEKAKLNIAYLHGMAYAPINIIKEQKLIEKYYDNVEVTWQIISAGTAMNEAIIAGSVDVAYMGVGPFLTGAAKGIPYKLHTSLCAVPMGLNTNNPNIQSLADFSPDDKIALPSINSIQHVVLAFAAEKELGDAHALDNNIINMGHPDGMQALLSGTITGHLTTSPYYNKELDEANIHEITSVVDAFPENCTTIVGVATEKLYKENRELYDALCKATNESIDYVNNNKAEVAKLLCENEGVTEEVMEEYLNHPDVLYTSQPSGILEVAEFMERTKMIETAPKTMEDIYFDNLLK